jgi:perosamine synthetase
VRCEGPDEKAATRNWQQSADPTGNQLAKKGVASRRMPRQRRRRTANRHPDAGEKLGSDSRSLVTGGLGRALEWRIHQVEPSFDHEEVDGLADAVRSGWLTEGPQAAEFLTAIQADTGARHAVLAPNGTLGLFLALLALDLPSDSEILIPAFTFYASATAAVFAGLRPVFVDADPETFNLDVDALESLITDRSAAIMPVHVYGHSPPLDRILDLGARHDLVVLEDAAQAYGVAYQGRHAGTWGHAGVISFFADKTITTGEGGVVLTDDANLFEKLRLLRNQGRVDSGTFVHPSLGMNFRVTDLQCAVGRAQLRKLPEIVAKKRENHARYVDNLRDVGGVRWLQVQPGSTHVPFRFALLSERRTQVIAALEEAGVQTRGFFYPLHLQPALKKYAHQPLPVAEELYDKGVCLPVHQGLTSSEIDEISEIVRTVHDGL